jgi:hypothetical protein
VETEQFEKEKNARSAAAVLKSWNRQHQRRRVDRAGIITSLQDTHPKVFLGPCLGDRGSVLVSSFPGRAGVGNSCNASTSILGLQVNCCRRTEPGTSMVRWRYQLALEREITLLFGSGAR